MAHKSNVDPRVGLGAANATPFTISDYYASTPGQQAKIREILTGSTTGEGDIASFAPLLRNLSPQALKLAGVTPAAQAMAPVTPTPGSAFNVGAPQTFTPTPQPAVLPALAGGGGMPAMGGGTPMGGMPASANPWMSLLAQLGGMGMFGGGGGMRPPAGGQMMGQGAPMPPPMQGGGNPFGSFGGFPSLLMGGGMGGQQGTTRRLLMDRLFGGMGQPGSTPGTFTG